MRVTLRKLFGEGVDDALVTVPDFLVGRSVQCHLRLNCPHVSRMHCELIVRDGYVAVRDLGSRNGTFVNDSRVLAERQLIPGDSLRLGLCFFEVVIDESGEFGAESHQPDLEHLPAEVSPVSHMPCDASGSLAG